MNSKMEKDKVVKMRFKIYFEGIPYYIPSVTEEIDTYRLGLCKLEYNDKDNTLTVYLRRPGLLIGKKGEQLRELEKYLKCKVCSVRRTVIPIFITFSFCKYGSVLHVNWNNYSFSFMCTTRTLSYNHIIEIDIIVNTFDLIRNIPPHFIENNISHQFSINRRKFLGNFHIFQIPT